MHMHEPLRGVCRRGGVTVSPTGLRGLGFGVASKPAPADGFDDDAAVWDALRTMGTYPSSLESSLLLSLSASGRTTAVTGAPVPDGTPT